MGLEVGLEMGGVLVGVGGCEWGLFCSGNVTGLVRNDNKYYRG